MRESVGLRGLAGREHLVALKLLGEVALKIRLQIVVEQIVVVGARQRVLEAACPPAGATQGASGTLSSRLSGRIA